MVPLVLVGLLALPTLPAHAATGPDVVVFEAEGSLYRAAPDLTGAVLIGEEDGRVEDVRASADGSRFAYTTVQVGAPGRPNDRRTRVVVRDVSGRQVAVVGDEIGYDGGDVISGPAVGLPSLSADGNRVMWGGPHGFQVGPVQDDATGTPVALGPGYVRGPRFAGPFDDVLAIGIEPFVDGTYSDAVLQVRNGKATKLPGLVGPAADFAVAPDGSTLAYVSYEAGSDAESLNVAPLTRSGDGVLSAGAPTRLVNDFQDEDGPRYSRDSSTLLWSTPGRDLMSVPAAGGPVTQRTDTPTRLESVAVGMAVDDGAAPAPISVLPFVFDGLHVHLRWTLPADADLSGVLVQVRTSGGYLYPVDFVPAPATGYDDFSYGKVNYELSAVDRSGHLSSTVTRSAEPIDPFVTFPTPVATTTTTAFTLKLPAYGAHNSLWYRPYGTTGPLVQLLDKAEQSTYLFDQGTAGGNYGFLVQSFDAFGNATAQVGGGTAMVPFDQNRAAFSGSVLTESRPDRYLGSATILRTAGSAARFTTSATLLRIVGERCRSCGVMDVYVDGSRIAGIDTYSADRKVRQVLLSKGLTSGKHTVVIKARGTVRHPWVVLDALGLR
jgi:hypothetical protein